MSPMLRLAVKVLHFHLKKNIRQKNYMAEKWNGMHCISRKVRRIEKSDIYKYKGPPFILVHRD